MPRAKLSLPLVSLFMVSLFIFLLLTVSASAQNEPIDSADLLIGTGVLIAVTPSLDGTQIAVLTTRQLAVYAASDLTAPPTVYPFAHDLFGRLVGTTFINAELEAVIDGWRIYAPSIDGLPPLTLHLDPSTGTQTLIDVPPERVVGQVGDLRLSAPTSPFQLGLTVIDTRTDVRTLLEPLRDVRRVFGYALSANGKFAAAGFNADTGAVVRVWDTATGEQTGELAITDGRVSGVSASGSTLLLTVSDETRAFPDFDVTAMPIVWLDRLLTAAPDRFVLWREDAAPGQGEYRIFTDPTAEPQRIAAPDCPAIAVGAILLADQMIGYTRFSAGTLIVYDLTTNAMITRVGGYAPIINQLAWDAAGRLLTVGGDTMPYPCAVGNPANAIAAYNVQTQQVGAVTLLPSYGQVIDVAGETWAVGYGGATMTDTGVIALYENGEPSVELRGAVANYRINDLDLTADYLGAISGGRLHVWRRDDLRAGAEIYTVPEADTTGWGQALAIDGDSVIYGHPFDHRVFVVDLPSGDIVQTVEHPAPIEDLTLYGDRLVVNTGMIGQPRMLHVYERTAAGWTLVRAIELPPDLLAGAFHPAGTLYAVAKPNGDAVAPTALLIDLTTGLIVQEWSNAFVPLIFTPDGTAIISAYGALLRVSAVSSAVE